MRRVRIAVARETREGETRVALVPELVGKLTGLGYEVAVEPGAGLLEGLPVPVDAVGEEFAPPLVASLPAVGRI